MQLITFEDQDIKHILKAYPKSVKTFGAFIKNFYDKSGAVLPEDFDSVVPSIIQYSPRTLYDFFDAEAIQVGINYYPRGAFSCEVNGEHQEDQEDQNSRTAAERAGFIKAFQIMENR